VMILIRCLFAFTLAARKVSAQFLDQLLGIHSDFVSAVCVDRSG
jgi:hypothetical protein